MKKIITLIMALTLVLSLTVLFASCDEECTAHVDANWDSACDVCEAEMAESVLLPKDFLSYVEKPEQFFDKAAAQSDLVNMSVVNNSGNLILFRNSSAAVGENAYAVFNSETGKVVFDLAKNDDSNVSYSVQIMNNVIVFGNENLNGDRTYTTTLYSAIGEKIASVTNEAGNVTPNFYNSEYFTFGEKLYNYVDNKATAKFDIGFRKIPSFDYATETKFYDIENTYFRVYDAEFKLVNAYDVPSNAKDSKIFVLNDGNILIQYSVALPGCGTTAYDYYDGEKYDLVSVIYNVESGEETEASLNFKVTSVRNSITDPDFAEQGYKGDAIVNLASIKKVKNSAIANNTEYVTLSNEAAIVSFLGREIANQNGIAKAIAEDRYEVKDKAGNRFIVNGNGELVGEVTTATTKSYGLVYGNKYYDFDLKLTYEFNADKYVRMCTGDDFAVYRETITEADSYTAAEYQYYIFRNGKMSKLNVSNNVNNFRSYDSYFAYTDVKVTDGETIESRVYCNADGSKILEATIKNGSAPTCQQYGDSIVFSFRNTETGDYDIRIATIK